MSRHEGPLENDKDSTAEREQLLQRCRELEQENADLKLIGSEDYGETSEHTVDKELGGVDLQSGVPLFQQRAWQSSSNKNHRHILFQRLFPGISDEG